MAEYNTMSELRRRPVASARINPAAEETPAAVPMSPVKKTGGCPVKIRSGTYYYVRKAVVILFPAYVLCCMFEVLEPPRPLMEHTWDAVMLAMGKGPRIFTASELKAKGVGRQRMLSILGEVFDVSKGRKHYGKGGAYEGFTGRDASRAFVSGDFSEAGLTDDVSGLEPSQCLGIKDWLDFYVNDDKYKKRGLLAGRFYNSRGKPTKELAKFHECVAEGRKEKDREAEERLKFPSCNSRWAAAEGGRVWCQDPQKVPRKFRPKEVHGAGVRRQGPLTNAAKKDQEEMKDGEGGAPASDDAAKVKGRCSCFDLDYAKTNEARLLSYGGCAPESNSCVTRPPEASNAPKPKRNKTAKGR